MATGDWSSDVCSSDHPQRRGGFRGGREGGGGRARGGEEEEEEKKTISQCVNKALFIDFRGKLY